MKYKNIVFDFGNVIGRFDGKAILSEFCPHEEELDYLSEIVAESLNVEESTLSETTSFKEDLGADSLDLFEMVMAFEEAFEVEIPSEDLEQITTVGDVVKYIESHK